MATKTRAGEGRPEQTLAQDEPVTAQGQREPVAEAKEWPRGVGQCVVDDGTPHTGRATPGAKICSAHAMHYHADGTRRRSPA